MSRQEKIDPSVLVAQIQAIRDQINRLQAFIAELAAARSNVARSREGIKALRSTGNAVILPLDPHMNTLATVKPVDSESVIVHLGLDVYAKMPIEKAVEVLDAKEERLSRSISEASKQLNELTKLHDQYQALLQSIAASQARESRG